MTRKEKIRFFGSLLLSAAFILFSALLLDALIAKVFWIPSKMTETFYGFALFSKMMASKAHLLIGIGTLSVGALGAFFASSLRQFERKAVRISMKTVFAADLAFIVLDVLSLVILLL